jgi:hypothetical protein
MITAYSWAAGLFQQVLPSSLADIEKRAKLVNEISTPLVKAKNGQDKMLIDLDGIIGFRGITVSMKLHE